MPATASCAVEHPKYVNDKLHPATKPARFPKVCEMYAYAEPACDTRCVNAMKERATRTMAAVPTRNVNGAADPVACTTKGTLKAAATVGQIMDSDMPTASGRLRRFDRLFVKFMPAASF